MRENDIEKDKVLSILNENMEIRSKGLMKIVEKEGSKKIADLLKSLI